MINDEEASAVFDELLGILRENNLGWLNDEIIEVVESGKPEDVRVEVAPKESSSTEVLTQQVPAKRRTSTATFTKVRDYLPKEKLKLTIEAINRAVVHPAEIANVLVDEFKHIQFRPDVENENAVLLQKDKPILLMPDETKERLQLVEHLSSLLQELESQV